MTKDNRARVAWISPQLNYAVASTRYRCYYPAIALEEFNISSEFYRASREVISHLNDLDAIVFVKLLDSDSLQLAGLAKDKGVKVFIDLCDNIVVANYPMVADLQPALRFAAIGAFADAIVVPSPALVESLAPLLRCRTRFSVVPDQIETFASVSAAGKLQEQINRSASPTPLAIIPRALRFAAYTGRDPAGGIGILKRKIESTFRPVMERFNGLRAPSNELVPAMSSDVGLELENVSGQPRPKSVVWFGNFGAQHSDFGMLALLLAAPALESVCRDIPLQLTVISNRKALFNRAIKQIGVPTRYVEWSAEAVFRELGDADVCLLPFGTDVFSATKSANRVVLALHQGVPVITSRLRSMDPLEGVVVFDDWEAGLRRFLGSSGETERASTIVAAEKILANTYSAHSIGKTWAALIRGATARIRPGYANVPTGGEVAVLVEDAKSADLLLPIVDALQKRSDVLLRVLVTPEALAAVVPAMIERRIIPYALEDKPSLAGDDRVLRTVDWLFIADSTDRDAEGMAAAIVKIARERNVSMLSVTPGPAVTHASVIGNGIGSSGAETADAAVDRLLSDAVENRQLKGATTVKLVISPVL